MINFEDNDVRQFVPRSLLQWLVKCINKQDKYIEANAVKGDKGDKGDTVVSVQIGSTTTGEAGTNASVTNVGTNTEAILDFTIPKGVKGDKGDTGATGERGEKGEQGLAASIAIGTVTSVDNSQPAKVTNSGTAQNAILDFEIPKGLDGKSFNYMGEWVENNEYYIDDVVKYGGNQYICIKDVSQSATSPDLDTTNFSLFLSSNYKWINGAIATNEQKQACLLCKATCTGQFTYDGLLYNVSAADFAYFRKDGATTSINAITFAYNIEGNKVLTNVQAIFNFYLNSSGEIVFNQARCILLDKNLEQINIENANFSFGSMLTIV